MKYVTVVFMFVMLSAVAWGQIPEAEGKATLADQKACSDQAAKVDADERNQLREAHPAFHVYTSHYDRAADVCYVMFFDLDADEVSAKDTFSRSILFLDLAGRDIRNPFLDMRMGHIRDCIVFVGHIQECTTFSPGQVAFCSMGRLPIGDCFELARWATWLCARREQPPYRASPGRMSYAEFAFCGADGLGALAP